ncbi:GFA family protein [Rheinheimera sp.]|uniref:GFA family protein n=1 Tax=Rheinheimera sp. TaxID=1869214 RepID=UPI0027BA1ACA|nr:GFA family protein [Rheinheimera sp.]
MSEQQTTKIAVQGHCLCGAVSFSAFASTALDACHCGMCRRWGGGPLLAVHCGTNVEFSGAEHIAVYASSDWAERAFCRGCGSHLYYRFIPQNSYIVPVGLLTAQEQFVFTEQIFIDHKPAYYRFANQTAELTEAEVLAKFAGPEV